MNGFFDPSKYQQVEKVSEQYTRMPNYIIDDGLMAQLSDKAFKCYMLITRYTTGYNKATAQIATTTFQKHCKAKRVETIYACIRELEQVGLIKVERKAGVLNTYSLQKMQSNQYGKTVVAENSTSTVEQGGTSTVEQGGTSTVEQGWTSTVEPYTYKENLKEKSKEKGEPEFFAEFWDKYPKCKRKGAKGDALKTFTKYKSHGGLILRILDLFKLDDQWIKQDGEFIPAPSSWLNKKHWENEFWLERLQPEQTASNRQQQPKQIDPKDFDEL